MLKASQLLAELNFEEDEEDAYYTKDLPIHACRLGKNNSLSINYKINVILLYVGFIWKLFVTYVCEYIFSLALGICIVCYNRLDKKVTLS